MLLYAADGRYQEDYRKIFTNVKQFRLHDSKKNEDEAFSLFSDLVGSDSSRMWTPIDLEQEYATLRGSKLTRKKIVECILADTKMISCYGFHLVAQISYSLIAQQMKTFCSRLK